jgi:hypothetical protein
LQYAAYCNGCIGPLVGPPQLWPSRWPPRRYVGGSALVGCEPGCRPGCDEGWLDGRDEGWLATSWMAGLLADRKAMTLLCAWLVRTAIFGRLSDGRPVACWWLGAPAGCLQRAVSDGWLVGWPDGDDVGWRFGCMDGCPLVDRVVPGREEVRRTEGSEGCPDWPSCRHVGGGRLVGRPEGREDGCPLSAGRRR